MARIRKKLLVPMVLAACAVIGIGVELLHRKMQASLKDLRDTNEAGA